METRALNVYQSRPPLEYVEDSEEDETPIWTCKAEYEQRNRLFMTRILLESTVEDLHATSITSQKLAKGAYQSTETQREPFIPPDCVRGFESVFAKEDFDILPEHRQWDHAIELILGLEPKLSKVYSLSPVEQKELDAFLEENLPLQIPHGSSSILHQEEGWLTLVGSRLSYTQLHDGQEQVPFPTNLRTCIPTLRSQILHQARHPLGFQQCLH